MASSPPSPSTSSNGTRSPCWEGEDDFHPICVIVISTGIVVFFVSVACIYQIVKLCAKLRRDKHIDENLRCYQLQNMSQQPVGEAVVPGCEGRGGGGGGNGIRETPLNACVTVVSEETELSANQGDLDEIKTAPSS